MIKIDKAVATALHNDMFLLMKAYSRVGYEQINGGEGVGFERLWQATFGSQETINPQTPAQLQARTLTE